MSRAQPPPRHLGGYVFTQSVQPGVGGEEIRAAVLTAFAGEQPGRWPEKPLKRLCRFPFPDTRLNSLCENVAAEVTRRRLRPRNTPESASSRRRLPRAVGVFTQSVRPGANKMGTRLQKTELRPGGAKSRCHACGRPAFLRTLAPLRKPNPTRNTF